MGWGNFGCSDNFGYHFFIPIHIGAYEFWFGQYTIQYGYELMWKIKAAKIPLASKLPQFNSTHKKKIFSLNMHLQCGAVFMWSIFKKILTKIPHSLPVGCLWWIQHLIDILPEFLQSFLQCLITLNHVIMALNYIYTRVLISATWRHNNSTILSL